jgi:fructosamine-3-kinase
VQHLIEQLRHYLGNAPRAVSPLSGGCVGRVFKAELPDGSYVVVKAADGGGTLDVEGFMLQYLAEHSVLPVPRVLVAEPELLVMEYVPGKSRFSGDAEVHAAELLADLHSRASGQFGLERDTLIGALPQPNTRDRSWISFFRDRRLLHMARETLNEGRIARTLFDRVEKLGERLDELLVEPERPSLIHGDVWTTNVLASGDRIAAFLDPAIYYADPEIELAFITLFSTFGKVFFGRYHELRPIRPGFFETRRHVYNLFPLLVHVRLFGGSYVDDVSGTLSRLGF